MARQRARELTFVDEHERENCVRLGVGRDAKSAVNWRDEARSHHRLLRVDKDAHVAVSFGRLVEDAAVYANGYGLDVASRE